MIRSLFIRRSSCKSLQFEHGGVKSIDFLGEGTSIYLYSSPELDFFENEEGFYCFYFSDYAGLSISDSDSYIRVPISSRILEDCWGLTSLLYRFCSSKNFSLSLRPIAEIWYYFFWLSFSSFSKILDSLAIVLRFVEAVYFFLLILSSELTSSNNYSLFSSYFSVYSFWSTEVFS